VINVIVHQRPLCLRYGILDGVELLRDIETWSPFLHHGDYRAEMTLDTLEPLHNVRMALVQFRFCRHYCYPILLEGILFTTKGGQMLEAGSQPGELVRDFSDNFEALLLIETFRILWPQT
jgi:hypothetical protein